MKNYLLNKVSFKNFLEMNDLQHPQMLRFAHFRYFSQFRYAADDYETLGKKSQP